jgi:hypothetical protein
MSETFEISFRYFSVEGERRGAYKVLVTEPEIKRDGMMGH